MKRPLASAAMLLCFCSAIMARGGEADVHLHSLSVRLGTGTAQANALNYTLDVTTGSPAESIFNGELGPLPPNSPGSHGAFYRMDGDVFFEPVFGLLAVNVPDMPDSDTNGVPDFFDIEQPVPSTTTLGTFEDVQGSGRITAVWSREAKTKNGTCRLTFEPYNLTFVHPFEIIEFRGRLNYGSTETNVTGHVTLTKTMEPERSLSGPMELNKISEDELELRSGAWQTDAGLSVVYQGTEGLQRNGTSYVDLLTFQDGDPSTSAEDYLFWIIRVTDRSDSDQDGIPDISDEAVARLPSIEFAGITRSNILLSVSGEIGKTHEIQQATSVMDATWLRVARIVLTNDPQTVSIRLPRTRIGFWRVRVP